MVIWLDKMLENYNIIKHFCDGIFILELIKRSIQERKRVNGLVYCNKFGVVKWYQIYLSKDELVFGSWCLLVNIELYCFWFSLVSLVNGNIYWSASC